MEQRQVYDATKKEFIEIEFDNTEDPQTEAKLFNARGTRDTLLKESDWTMLSDNSLTEEQKTEATTYRQALRDLPAQEGFPDVEFPTKPDFL